MVVVPALIRGSLVTTPVSAGEYDDSKPANPGANRWEWRLGISVQYITGLLTNQIFRSVGANYTQ